MSEEAPEGDGAGVTDGVEDSDFHGLLGGVVLVVATVELGAD
ncbi:MAG: hypothetical protein RI897_3715 [Verrucomicrobiota bacterium]